MGVGSYLSIRSHESARAAERLPPEEEHPIRHGLATWIAFVVAGAFPLLPYTWAALPVARFDLSLALTLLTLFAVGAARSLVTVERWWRGGLEMLVLGVVVAAAGYASGAAVAAVIGVAG